MEYADKALIQKAAEAILDANLTIFPAEKRAFKMRAKMCMEDSSLPPETFAREVQKLLEHRGFYTVGELAHGIVCSMQKSSGRTT